MALLACVRVARQWAGDDSISRVATGWDWSGPNLASRLVLADYFTDIERKFNPHAVIIGATMMASTENGFCFTHQEFSEWLAEAGVTAIRLIEPIGFQQSFVGTKPHG